MTRQTEDEYDQKLLSFQYNFKSINASIDHILSLVLDQSAEHFSLEQRHHSSVTVSRADLISSTSAAVPTSVSLTTHLETPMPYLTTRFMGRLGNQMFEYASLLGLARAQNRRPFVKDGGNLANIFQISLVNREVSSDGWKVMSESGYATFDSRFMKLPEVNLIITGYLQCWRYLIHAQDEIRREFTLSSTLQKYAEGVLTNYRRQMDNHVLVGVHIRRGDFLSPNLVRAGYGVPNASYFTKAFNKLRSLLPNQNITFLVASDDVDWCKNNLNDRSVRILPRGSGNEHFAIVSSCDHVILTGGTYGWWSAWLANGITVYFKDFVADNKPLHSGFNDGDYYPPGWIGLEN
ncbi:Galactoside 2-alpha-L-fucosyltransferase 1 [Bulinus truncatus]|nr:Galactoside 2-alpha-L-fucosyltransferase 1 [Bulinus truncatus]